MNAPKAGLVIIVGSVLTLCVLAIGLSGKTPLRIERGQQLWAALLIVVGSLAHGLRRWATSKRAHGAS